MIAMIVDSWGRRGGQEACVCQAGQYGPSAPWITGECKTFKLMSVFQTPGTTFTLHTVQPTPPNHLRPHAHTHTKLFSSLSVSIKEPNEFMRYRFGDGKKKKKKKAASKASGLVLFRLFIYLFMYFIRMSFKWKDEHLHDNRLEEQRREPQGERQYP